ncbi:hypothetical protein [Methylocystis parvus]|uniref:Uncharacterized protein n=1 Tax=Methylocystis parvus TaxID=134 RepID=A0A6B8MG05_9HYPH|nr:hypothetical protein [Methylocystis parvus]QGN00104.1 hypothetical protein F7D14_21235 [Methylocystis parvus]WBK02396.1 hypothetical protein MMG94_21405 [Methylocystis parvus OBBP]
MSSSNESNLLTGHIGEEEGFLAVICPNVATSTKSSIAGRVELIQSDALAFGGSLMQASTSSLRTR